MRRYILFTEEELIKMIRGGEIAHKISGTNETLYFICSDYFTNTATDTDTDDTNDIPASFVFKTEEAARFAIMGLKNKCRWYGVATLADWNDICGLNNADYLFNHEGWLKKDLENITIDKTCDGYEVKLPGTIYID